MDFPTTRSYIKHDNLEFIFQNWKYKIYFGNEITKCATGVSMKTIISIEPPKNVDGILVQNNIQCSSGQRTEKLVTDCSTVIVKRSKVDGLIVPDYSQIHLWDTGNLTYSPRICLHREDIRSYRINPSDML